MAMTLDEYLASPDALSLTDLSEKVGVSKGRLSQLRQKDTRPNSDFPPRLALDLEGATEGKIDAATLSSVVADARHGGRDVAA